MNLEQQLNEAFEQPTIAISLPTDEERNQWEVRKESPWLKFKDEDVDKVVLRPGKLIKKNKLYELWINKDHKEREGNIFFNQIEILPTEWLKQLSDRINQILATRGGNKQIPDAEDSLPDEDVFRDDNYTDLCSMNIYTAERNPRDIEKNFVERYREGLIEINNILKELNIPLSEVGL